MSDHETHGVQDAAAAAGSNAPVPADEAEALAAEVRAVRTLLEEALDELYAPLSDLARTNLRATEPPLRALVVLSTGVSRDAPPALRERRILLAAALEMLAVALRIHNLLLSAAAAQGKRNGAAHADEAALPELDRSLAGSTILTGDYCFSRAAVLAAQTDSPTVVEIFSQALKNVSEGRLRAFFDPDSGPFVEDTELMHAGVRGAVHLAGLTPAHEQSACALADALRVSAPLSTAELADASISATQRDRWQAAWRIAAGAD